MAETLGSWIVNSKSKDSELSNKCEHLQSIVSTSGATGQLENGWQFIVYIRFSITIDRTECRVGDAIDSNESTTTNDNTAHTETEIFSH